MTSYVRKAVPVECDPGDHGLVVTFDPVGGGPERCSYCGESMSGREADRWGIWPLVIALVVAAALVGIAMALAVQGTNRGGIGGTGGGTAVTPSPYGPPEGNRTLPVGSLPTPVPAPIPVVR